MTLLKTPSSPSCSQVNLHGKTSNPSKKLKSRSISTLVLKVQNWMKLKNVTKSTYKKMRSIFALSRWCRYMKTFQNFQTRKKFFFVKNWKIMRTVLTPLIRSMSQGDNLFLKKVFRENQASLPATKAKKITF